MNCVDNDTPFPACSVFINVTGSDNYREKDTVYISVSVMFSSETLQIIFLGPNEHNVS